MGTPPHGHHVPNDRVSTEGGQLHTETPNILEAARDAGCRHVIFVSSAAINGDAPGLPKTESMILRPLSSYVTSKLPGEPLCSVFSGTYGLETVALRYFNVFGPGQDP